MLNLISRVLADLVKQGLLVRDVAALVDRLKRPDTKLNTFTEAEVRKLLNTWRTTGSATRGEVKKIRLHDARHSCASIMHAQGVPIAAISEWLGHADAAFTMRTYVHVQNDALKTAATTFQRVVST